MLALLRSLAAHERCARNSESSANNHQTKRNVGESGLHPNPPLPSVDYPAKGSPINIPIFIGLSSVLARKLQKLGDLASYRKANTGSSPITELPVSQYSILWHVGCPGVLLREDIMLVDSLGSAGRGEGGWGLRGVVAASCVVVSAGVGAGAPYYGR